MPITTKRRSRKEHLKGYVYKPATGSPVLVYARPYTGIALGITVRDGDLADVPVSALVARRAPGLYRARVTSDVHAPAAAGRFSVLVGTRTVDVGNEVRRLVALAARPKRWVAGADPKRRRKGAARQPATPARLRTIRGARALLDALRREVLPLTNPTPAQPAEATP